MTKTKDDATVAVASIGDAAECGKRADALARRVLGRVMRQARSVATVLDYVLALSRDVRANAGFRTGSLTPRIGRRPGGTSARTCDSRLGRGADTAAIPLI